MHKVTQCKVKILVSGTALIAKQMQANAGELLPAHLASVESILLVQKGECVFKMNDKDLVLTPGDSIVVPPDIQHQIKANKDFKAFHFMPK